MTADCNPAGGAGCSLQADYVIIRRDRNRMGGGVVICIRNCIPYIFRTDLNLENAEAVCLEIKKRKVKPLLVSTWYRPPNANCEFFTHFENFLKKIDNENSENRDKGGLQL